MNKQFWAERYRLLHLYGFTDGQIAELAGKTRSVINAVRRGKWPYAHDVDYHSGKRVEAECEKVRQQLQLDLEATAE